MEIIRFIIFSLFLSGAPMLLAGQHPIQKQVQQFLTDPALRHAGVGICVVDVASGKQVAAFQEQLSLCPASSFKVLTTASALAILGADYRFLTQLEMEGTLQRGTLQGNLVIRGFGDPTLGSAEMPGALGLDALLGKFREVARQKGIKKVTGSVIGDGTAFSSDATAPGWPWYDLGNYYASGAWGLNILENQYKLHFQRTNAVGAQPRISSMTPHVPGMEFINEVVQAAPGSGDQAYIYGAPFTYLRYVRGTIPAGTGSFTIKGALPDPPAFCAYQFREVLRAAGIPVEGEAASRLALQQAGKDKRLPAQILYRHYAPPLKEIVRQANYESNNLYCEAFLRAIGRKQSGAGTREKGIEAIQNYWKQRGLGFDGCFFEDGSGLSTRNAVTAAFMANLLGKVGRDARLYPIFSSTLAQAGRSGNLKNKWKGTPAEGKLWAKSGSMDRVRSYAGYARNSKNQLFAFSIIINNYNGSGTAMRDKMERLMLAFCE